jgi:DivIVA domain-containing protein
MLSDKIELSPEEIYEKEFKVDARGYRPQEVDNFLDIVIKDYTEFIKIIRNYDKKLQSLTEENRELKGQIRNLETTLESARENSSDDVNNVDILRRLSKLEKIVYSSLK